MESLTGIKLVYTSPAYPFPNIHFTWIYELGRDEKGTYIFDGNLVQYYEYEVIQQMFTPTEYSWKEIDSKNENKN